MPTLVPSQQHSPADVQEYLEKATALVGPDAVDVAIDRATGLFEAFPQLAISAATVPGCSDLSWRDVFGLLIAARSAQEEIC